VSKTRYMRRIVRIPYDYARDKWRAFRRLTRKQQIAVLSGIALIVLIVIPALTFLWFVRDISDKDRLMNRNNTGVVVTDRQGEVIYSFGRSSDERNVDFDEISEHLVDALISSEDRSFYDHGGFSPRNIAGAVVANVLNRDATRYGGSTITQQLVKNNLLTDRKSFLRKYQELSMAVAIEQQYSKEEILEMYLNSVYFGEGAFGILQASETYFDTTPAELNLAQSSMLVGLLPAPSLYSPISGDPELAEAQQARVLDRMLENGKIDETQMDGAASEVLVFAEIEPEIQENAHHFTQMVMDELIAEYGEERVARSGFRVETTIDLGWQKEAERIVQERIRAIRGQGATNAALVAIDPTNGHVRALVGSANWSDEQFGQVNMATSPRQPGSSFKPIYYAEALDQKLITASTIIRDQRKEYGDYRPENFDFRFRGDIAVRHALAQSLNIPAIEVLQTLGVQEGADTAQRMGISTVTEPEIYGLSLALGTAETRLTEMTNAYAAFANRGDLNEMTLIARIENKFGRTTFQARTRPERVQSAESSYIISEILSDNQARSPTFGSSLNVAGKQVAVKTGTTNDNKDAWTIGYTPEVAVGVWVGDNELNPMTIGGSAAAGPIWRSTLSHILGDGGGGGFDRPRGIVGVQVCNLHGTYVEVFIRGTQPDRCERDTSAEDEAADRARREEEERRRAEEERRRLEEEREREREQDDDDEDEPDDDDEPEVPAEPEPAPEPPSQPEPPPPITPPPGLIE
jgi:1A family penicillin-binding protein